MIIIERNKGNYPVYRIPGIIRTEKGTLIAYYECRENDGDRASVIDIEIIRSTDNGKTWESVKIVHLDLFLNNPVMIPDGDDIHFIFCMDYRRVFYSKSTDDGLSWSEPSEITDVFRNGTKGFTSVAVGPGHGIKNRRGVLEVPFWCAYNPDHPDEHRPSYIGILYSDDHGKTWNIGENIDREDMNNPSECCLANMSDGSVLLNIRHENEERTRILAVSENGIDGFFSFESRKDIPDPVCMGGMTNDGDLILFSNCASSTRQRINLTLKISDDGLKTFREILVDEIGGYSDVAAADGKAYVFYERYKNGCLGLYFKEIQYC